MGEGRKTTWRARSRLAIVAALLACALAAAAWPSGAAAQAPPPYVGYSEGTFITRWLDPPVYPDQTGALLGLAGAQVHRIPVWWEKIEPQPGEFHWRQYAAMVSADLENGVRPLFFLSRAPKWAWDPAGSRCRKNPCNVPPGSDHLWEWQVFIAKLLQRFPETVALELWNEPNAPAKWQSLTGPSPSAYTQLLCKTYEVAKVAAPSVQVLTGSLNNGSSSSSIYPYQDFLRGIYDAGGGACFDGIGLHSYAQSPDVPPTDRFFAVIDAHRSVAAEKGDAGRDLWVTEFGSATQPTASLTETGQARGTINALNALEAMPDVRAALVFSLFEGATDTGYGEITREFRAKLAYCALGYRWTGLNPCRDSDGDGASDVSEVGSRLDPGDPDFDDDGTPDGSDSAPRNPRRAGVEGVPPQITSGPPDPTTEPSATFAFTTTLMDGTFECRLDARAWSGCSSPVTYDRLGDGAHTFAVRAVDVTGTPGQAARATFQVNAGLPEVTISPMSGTKKARKRGYRRFILSVSKPVQRIFCSLDGAKFAPCTSPYRTPRLRRGRHVLRAAAMDDRGRVGPVAKKRFRVRRHR